MIEDWLIGIVRIINIIDDDDCNDCNDSNISISITNNIIIVINDIGYGQ